MCGKPYLLLVFLLLLLLLRGTILNRSLLPAKVVDEINRQYITCDQSFPIWPGELRMPTCGEVELVEWGRGIVPSDEAALGVTGAVCYTVRYSNMFWKGNVRHEMQWYERSVDKVAIQEDSRWQIFPDQGLADSERWKHYHCASMVNESGE